jgi:hypothetical protein
MITRLHASPKARSRARAAGSLSVLGMVLLVALAFRAHSGDSRSNASGPSGAECRRLLIGPAALAVASTTSTHSLFRCRPLTANHGRIPRGIAMFWVSPAEPSQRKKASLKQRRFHEKRERAAQTAAHILQGRGPRQPKTPGVTRTGNSSAHLLG